MQPRIFKVISYDHQANFRTLDNGQCVQRVLLKEIQEPRGRFRDISKDPEDRFPRPQTPKTREAIALPMHRQRGSHDTHAESFREQANSSVREGIATNEH
ncbi:hypothetical protein KM043_013680 [Ampulex compressa]|nr:hypothetical protein KM043_013680 [Ampulex compressa]